MRKLDIERHDFTKGCPRCESMRRGEQEISIAHSEACRRRITEAIRETEAGVERIRKQADRQEEALTRALKAEDRRIRKEEKSKRREKEEDDDDDQTKRAKTSTDEPEIRGSQKRSRGEREDVEESRIDEKAAKTTRTQEEEEQKKRQDDKEQDQERALEE